MKKIILLVSMIAGFAFIGSSQVKETKESSRREIKTPPAPAETSNPSTQTEISKPSVKPEIKPEVNQEVKPSVKPEIESKPQTIAKPVAKPLPDGRPVQVSNPTLPQKEKGPSLEQRKHAEEKSNGNAFSGKGKGGDKNLVDPGKKDPSTGSGTKKDKKENKKNK